MKEYDVKITETLEKTVTVQAESHDAAEEQVRAAYYNSEYILDSENFTGVAFGTTEEREVQKEQADTMNVLLVFLSRSSLLNSKIIALLRMRNLSAYTQLLLRVACSTHSWVLMSSNYMRELLKV